MQAGTPVVLPNRIRHPPSWRAPRTTRTSGSPDRWQPLPSIYWTPAAEHGRRPTSPRGRSV